MELKEAISIVKSKFQNSVDVRFTDSAILTFDKLLKAEYQNLYIALKELKSHNEIIEVTFFKSDRKGDRLIWDFVELGIRFYPKNIEELNTIIRTIKA